MKREAGRSAELMRQRAEATVQGVAPRRGGTSPCLVSIGVLVLVACGIASGVAAAPPNDDFGASARITGRSGRLAATNMGATREPGEPDHAQVIGGRSVWWRWVAPDTGGAHFETLGSDFDTVIAVYRGSSFASLEVVASSDDRAPLLQSAVAFEVEAGVAYRIAVDGFGGEAGTIRLAWRSSQPECSEPPAPSGPGPADGERGVEGEVTLSWDVAEEALVRRVIYGNDDRHEVFEEPDPRIREAARSVVALVDRARLVKEPDGYSVAGPRLESRMDFCPRERFLDQPAIPFCTGFLAAPDLVVTAGHCLLTEEECRETAILFGYRMADADTAVQEFAESHVRFCSEVIASEKSQEGDDWAIIRLDRAVDVARPLSIRRSGRIARGEDLVAIGHPLGLPLKIAAGAKVRDGLPETYFVTNTDTYMGSSGSPILGLRTLEVEGILVRGEEDFVEVGDCFRSRRCGEDECAGEDATRTTEFDALLPAGGASSYEVFFGPCGSLESLGETGETSWRLGRLDAGTEFCWQVMAKNGCGERTGAVWSFTTRPEPEFLRGDAVRDGRTNITDAIGILSQLFQGAEPPACRKAADADDSGNVNLTDAVYLLIFLFRAGEPPPPPFEECGLDPTDDALGCEPREKCVSGAG